MFDYHVGQIGRVRSYLDAHLWGEDGMPTERHPEDVVVVGEALLVLCFDPSDPAGDWYIDHLRRRHQARVANRCPALYTVQREIADAGAATPVARRPIIGRHEKELLNCSFGAMVVGELARELEDWSRAEAAFRRALELDSRGDALTRAGSLFEATYALGLAVSMNGRPTESEALFERAVRLAATEHNRKFLGWAQFNLACARAEGGRFAAAAEALEAAIAIDPSHKARAKTDRSFSKARAVPAFQRLLN